MDHRDVLPADSIGALALQRIRRSRHWRVLSVNRCCFYCEDDNGAIICIGTEIVGRGPITIKGKAIGVFLKRGISAGDALYSVDGLLTLPTCQQAIDLQAAEIWEESFDLSPHDLPGLESDIEALIRLARREAPDESLGALIPAIFSGSFQDIEPSGASKRLTQQLHGKALIVMRKAYRDGGHRHQQSMAEILAVRLGSLIGTGYGLTPSGDDFCCGVVLGMAHMGDYRNARELAELLKKAAEGKTTRISQAYYESLAESLVAEPQARLLASFGDSGGVDIREILMNNANHGSTSGWDMLAGFAFGLKLMKKRQRTGRIVCRQRCVC